MSYSLEQKWYEKDWVKLLFAIGLNVAFMALMLCCFEVRYEENDDLTVQKFLDGQTAVKSPFVIYINYFLALLIKGLYDLCDNALPVFSIFQYGLLLISFTGLCYLLFKRLNILAAVAGSMAVLCFIGADSYLVMTYTKTAGVATVGGISLMLLGWSQAGGVKRWLPLILGAMVAVLSFMLRSKEAVACCALMVPLGLWCLVSCAEASDKKIKAAAKFAAPFLLVAALALGLYAVNEYIWDNSEYSDYKIYNAARSRFVDYNIPDYEDMQEAYDRVNVDENTLELGNFYDTEKWTTETFDYLSDSRDQTITKPSWGECLGVFLNHCIASFFLQKHVYALVAVLLLWCCCGKRDWISFITVGLSFAIFGAMYLILIHQGRYLVNRTDVGFFFALTVTLLWFLEPGKAKKEGIFCALLIVLCLGLSYRQNREYCYYYADNFIMDDSAEKAAIETIIDDEHLFLTEVDSLNMMLYSPLETVPEGYADSIVLLGDWVVEHPKTTALLAQYGVENPYRDMVDNDKVYLVAADIELSLEYIRNWYCPEATAEPVEPLSSQTGLQIYKISTED